MIKTPENYDCFSKLDVKAPSRLSASSGLLIVIVIVVGVAVVVLTVVIVVVVSIQQVPQAICLASSRWTAGRHGAAQWRSDLA